MFKEIVNIFRDQIVKFIDSCMEIWHGEEHSDIPKSFKIITTIMMITVELVGICLLVTSIPIFAIMRFAITLICKGSFEDSNELG